MNQGASEPFAGIAISKGFDRFVVMALLGRGSFAIAACVGPLYENEKGT